MVAGFTTIAIKDAAGAIQQLAVYADAGGTLYPAPTGTDALGHILGLAANPIDSNLYVGGAAIALGSAASAASLPVVIASDQAAVATTLPGSVHLLPTSLVVTAGAYTTGQVVGGLLTLTSAVRASGGSGLIQSVLVTIKTALTAPYDIFFFDTNPTNSTFTDNSALAINVADLPFLCGVAHALDLTSGGTPQILQASNLALPFKLNTGTTLYAVIVIRGGQTFASTSAVQASVLVKQD